MIITKGHTMTTKTLTPAQIADEFGSDPRTVRKFLRSTVGTVGKGARHAVPGDARSLKSLRKSFDAWSAERAAKVEDEAPLTDADTTDDSPDA